MMFLATIDLLPAIDLFNGICSIGLGLWLYKVATRAAQIDRLEASLSSKQDQLIDMKVKDATNTLKASIEHISQDISAINTRLQYGEGVFTEIGDKRESMSIQLEKRFGDLRAYLAETFASKIDLKDHEKSVAGKFDRISDENKEIIKQVAVLDSMRREG